QGRGLAGHARGRVVERLERRGAPGAVVDARAPPDAPDRAAAVDPTAPRRVPGAVVLLGPLRREERLGPPVTLLLLPERAKRAAPVVPDDGGRAEPEPPSRLLERPAH